MPFFKETSLILRYAGLPAFFFLTLSTLIDQLINSQLEVALMSEDGGTSALIGYGIVSLFSGLLFPVLLTASLLYGLYRTHRSPESPADFLHRSFNQLLIETLRSWGSVLLWGLFLILPGLVRMFELIFVPYVVTALKSYENGQVDALKKSRHLVYKHWFILSLVLSANTLVSLALTDLLDPWRILWRTPASGLAIVFLELVINTVTVQLLFRFFAKALREDQDEFVFRLEGYQEPLQGTHV